MVDGGLKDIRHRRREGCGVGGEMCVMDYYVFRVMRKNLAGASKPAGSDPSTWILRYWLKFLPQPQPFQSIEMT